MTKGSFSVQETGFSDKKLLSCPHFQMLYEVIYKN